MCILRGFMEYNRKLAKSWRDTCDLTLPKSVRDVMLVCIIWSSRGEDVLITDGELLDLTAKDIQLFLGKYCLGTIRKARQRLHKEGYLGYSVEGIEIVNIEIL